MKHTRELVGRELIWTQPRAMGKEFELKDGDEVVATLRFRSSLGSFATAEMGGESWTFKRIGFWATRVTVCPAGSDEPIATFHNNTWHRGGTLELSDGRSFKADTNFWMTKFEFVSETEESLVRFQKIGGVFHLSSHVEVTHAAAELRELPWLMTLGWYLAVKMHDDAAAGAAS